MRSSFSSITNNVSSHKCQPLLSIRYYRPHPKDGEGDVFSLFTTRRGGGYHSPGFFSRLLVPRPFWKGGTPVPGSCPGHWSQVLSQVLSRGYPSPGGQDRTGVLPSQVRMGYLPGQIRMGYPPPPPRPGQAGYQDTS